MKTLFTTLLFCLCLGAFGQLLQDTSSFFAGDSVIALKPYKRSPIRAFYSEITVYDTLRLKGVILIDSGQKMDTTQVIMLASRCDDCKAKAIKGYHIGSGYYDRKWRKIEFVWISKQYIWKP